MSIATEKAPADVSAKQLEAWGLLEFTVQNFHCGVALSDVERVLPLMAFQAVPEAPEYLVGLLNLRLAHEIVGIRIVATFPRLS